jgi:hypothetical protein
VPGFDRTGPLGKGPLTGGGFGYCSRTETPDMGFGYGRGSARFAGGRGLGLGRRRGRGHGRSTPETLTVATQGVHTDNALAALRQEANDLRRHLANLESKISEIKQRSD